jgi:hypothetical protein
MHAWLDARGVVTPVLMDSLRQKVRSSRTMCRMPASCDVQDDWHFAAELPLESRGDPHRCMREA